MPSVDADRSRHGGRLRRPSGSPASSIAVGDGGVRPAGLDHAPSVDVKGRPDGWTMAWLGGYTAVRDSRRGRLRAIRFGYKSLMIVYTGTSAWGYVRSAPCRARVSAAVPRSSTCAGGSAALWAFGLSPLSWSRGAKTCRTVRNAELRRSMSKPAFVQSAGREWTPRLR